jgi:hypothetical protein
MNIASTFLKIDNYYYANYTKSVYAWYYYTSILIKMYRFQYNAWYKNIDNLAKSYNIGNDKYYAWVIGSTVLIFSFQTVAKEPCSCVNKRICI